MTRPLNDRQRRLLLHLAKHGACSPSSTLASLVKRRLVVRMDDYERKSWNEVVATLTTVFLTPAGKALARASGWDGVER